MTGYKKRLLNSGIKIDDERESLTTLQSGFYHFRDIQFDFLTYLIHKICTLHTIIKLII